MNKLPLEKRSQILACLCEGNSIRATARLTDTAKNTVVKLLCDAGRACSAYQDRVLRDLPCKRVQMDEIWTFTRMKEKRVPKDKKGELGWGDTWTWVALCADTKLVPSWFVGARDAEHARAFLADLASRMAGRIQLTSDGWRAYTDAVADIFLDQIDYAQFVKVYGESVETEKRYSPPECIGAKRTPVIGEPNPEHVSTSYVERANLTLRMSNRRFTRLTNAFSRKLENHSYSVSLHFMFYNFCRIHQSLRVTPAMAAGVTDRLWEVADIVRVLDEFERTESLPEGQENPDLTRLREDATTYYPRRYTHTRTSLNKLTVPVQRRPRQKPENPK